MELMVGLLVGMRKREVKDESGVQARGAGGWHLCLLVSSGRRAAVTGVSHVSAMRRACEAGLPQTAARLAICLI